MELLLIIPFYNEGFRLDESSLTEMFTHYPSTGFLLINDGSTDQTGTLLDTFAGRHPNVRALHLAKNSGKAQAIRQGVISTAISDYSYIGYMDADLATPGSELLLMEEFAVKNPIFTLVMGSRIKRLGSEIVRYGYRHYAGRVFATITSQLILKVPVYDTQCGAKVIESGLARELFREPFITKWLFDVELLLRLKAKDKNLQGVYEYPLNNWIEKGNSKIKLKELLSFPYQLLKIYFAYGR